MEIISNKYIVLLQFIEWMDNNFAIFLKLLIIFQEMCHFVPNWSYINGAINHRVDTCYLYYKQTSDDFNGTVTFLLSCSSYWLWKEIFGYHADTDTNKKQRFKIQWHTHIKIVNSKSHCNCKLNIEARYLFTNVHLVVNNTPYHNVY